MIHVDDDWKKLKNSTIPPELYRIRRLVRNVTVDPKGQE
jgi:hypothetical protein